MKPAAHQYEDKLLEFAYGELPAPEASAVEAHVQGCARCTQALGEIRAVRMTMGKLPQVEAPDAGLESLLAYAEQAARRNAAGPAGAPSWFKRMMAPLSAVAALSVLAVVGWKVSDESAGELMPPPAAVALKNEEKDLRRAAPEALAEAAPQKAEAPAPAAAAPAVAQAPAPEPEQAQEYGGGTKGTRRAAKDEADALDQAYGGERGGAEQRYGETLPSGAVADNLGKTQAPAEAKSDLKKSLETASKLSKSKRAAPARAEEWAAQEESKKAEKESVATRDARPADAPAPRPVAAAPPPPPPAPKPSGQALQGSGASNAGGFGLGVGNAGTRERSADFDDAEPVGSVAGGAPGGGRAQTAPSAAPSLEAQSAARGDLGVADKKRAASDADRMLAGARQARARNDRHQEIQLALQALKLGAQGEQRALALQHACEGYEALGDENRAGQFCDLLIREFPSSLSARRIAERRNAPQLAPSKSPARAKKEAKPAEADALEKPAEPKAAPASAY